MLPRPRRRYSSLPPVTFEDIIIAEYLRFYGNWVEQQELPVETDIPDAGPTALLLALSAAGILATRRFVLD